MLQTYEYENALKKSMGKNFEKERKKEKEKKKWGVHCTRLLLLLLERVARSALRCSVLCC